MLRPRTCWALLLTNFFFMGCCLGPSSADLVWAQSRTFDGTSDYFKADVVDAALRDGDLGMGCWINADTGTSAKEMSVMSIADATDDAFPNISLREPVNNTASFMHGQNNIGQSYGNIDSENSTQVEDEWAFHYGQFDEDTDGLALYYVQGHFEGTAEYTDTNLSGVLLRDYNLLSTVSIGRFEWTSARRWVDGKVSRCVIWSAVDGTEGIGFAKGVASKVGSGFAPEKLRPDVIWAYWPLNETSASANADALIGGASKDLTQSGSPGVSSDGPVIYYPRGGM